MSLSGVIARDAPADYLPAVAPLLLRWVTLVALLLMPVGMTAAPAMAQPASAAAGHCDEHQEPVDAPLVFQVHCAGCAALPAIDSPTAIAERVPQAPVLIALVRVSGIEPEIATPPPRLS